jgi:hypothetical protein
MALSDKAKQYLFDALANHDGDMKLASEEAIKKLEKDAHIPRPAAVALIAKAQREFT